MISVGTTRPAGAAPGPTIEEALRFDAEGLALEARLAYAEDVESPALAVLVCPPHPFLGGDMENNVVRVLATTLAARGHAVLRFNYRGIGGSQSSRDLAEDQRAFWHDSTCPRYEAEIARDCEHAFAELRRLLPDAPALAVIGYSFGCLPALSIAAAAPLSRLALVSPPLVKWPIAPERLDFRFPCALFYAPGDFACPADRIEDLHAACRGPRELHAFPEADHFFIGHEARLAEAIGSFLESP